jgi:hypothetical protein
MDWWKKRRVSKPRSTFVEKNTMSPAAPVDQSIGPIICQAEIAADIDRQIVEELRQYEAGHRRQAINSNSGN